MHLTEDTMPRLQRGFTLMELMTAITLAGIVLAVGAPSFQDFQRNARLTSAANEFLGAAFTARAEALKRQVPMAVCPSDNPSDASPTCSDGEFTGWIVFVDTDNDCLHTDDEAIVRAQPTLDAAVTTSSDGVCLSFAANGFRQVIAGRDTVSHALFCDDRGNVPIDAGDLAAPRGIEVQPTGRARITRSHTEITDWEAGFAVACP
jgi:type IV fimbrial biogenesis protein FimT